MLLLSTSWRQLPFFFLPFFSSLFLFLSLPYNTTFGFRSNSDSPKYRIVQPKAPSPKPKPRPKPTFSDFNRNHSRENYNQPPPNSQSTVCSNHCKGIFVFACIFFIRIIIILPHNIFSHNILLLKFSDSYFSYLIFSFYHSINKLLKLI